MERERERERKRERERIYELALFSDNFIWCTETLVFFFMAINGS